MSQKILLAVDGSERGFEAVSIVGNLIKEHPDLHLMLFHCVPQMAGLLPGELSVGLETSSLLTAADQKKAGDLILEESRRRLLAVGFSESRIELKLKANSIDPAQDIQAEAESGEIPTIAVGRRGLSQVKSLLLGSISSKVAQYALRHSVWIVDTPVPESRKVLVPVEGIADAQAVTTYLAETMAPIPRLEFTFLHLMPPMPPTFWDDGHILGSTEQRDRQSSVEKWQAEYHKNVEKFLEEGRKLLIEKGVPEQNMTRVIQPVKEGIARDLLNEVAADKYQVVVMGKRSFHERKPFLMGSHANKILQNLKGAILCLVDSR
jgi:nucleotide-binding universal stress UspA family protein